MHCISIPALNFKIGKETTNTDNKVDFGLDKM